MIFFADSSGIGALGLNWQSFLFQLLSFVIVLLILRQFVFKKLVGVLEARRIAVEQGLRQATEIEQNMLRAEKKIAGMLDEARKQAGDIVAAGHKQSAALVEAAEQKAGKRAEQIVAEARTQLASDITKARDDIKHHTMQLVAAATAKIIQQKLDARKDADLINDALANAKGGLSKNA